MEMVTGFKAAEVLGKTPIEVLGFAEYAQGLIPLAAQFCPSFS
jgi:hypothetical protein